MPKTLLLVLVMGLTMRPARADEILVRGVLLVDGSGGAPRADVDLLVAGGRIRAIEPSGVIEARGTVIEGAG